MLQQLTPTQTLQNQDFDDSVLGFLGSSMKHGLKNGMDGNPSVRPKDALLRPICQERIPVNPEPEKS